MPTLPELDVSSLPEPGDAEHLPPTTEVGDYLIEDCLGSGGFARVYRARHAVLGTRVAIKVLSRSLALDAEAMRRFVQEARAASRIMHPGVVRVLGFGKLPDGRAFQVMELIEGPTLEAYLLARGRLPTDEALSILSAIAQALDAAHAVGIVHRDLKPANVLLATVDGAVSPRLTDFGIAKAIEGEETAHLTRTGTTLGTPIYMSPEQALGRGIGPASDIYSFGVVAFEMLTGALPFEGESPFATMMMHVQTPPPTVSSIDATLGPRFDAAVRAMLAKQPADRPGSIVEAMATLATARPTATPRRRAGVVALLAAIIGTVIAIVAFTAQREVTARVPVLHEPTTRLPPAATVPPVESPDQAPISPQVAPGSEVPRLGTSPVSPSRPPTSKKRVPRSIDAGPSHADSVELPPDYEP